MYKITNYRDEEVLSINDKEYDNSKSLTFYGKGSKFGEIMNQNMLRLMEHFASSESNKPSNPVQGQIWFNLDKKTLNIWDGEKWVQIIFGGPKSLQWNKSTFTQTIDGLNSKYLDKITVKAINCKFIDPIPNDAFTFSPNPHTGLTFNITVDKVKNEAYIALNGQTLKNLISQDITFNFNVKAFSDVVDIATITDASKVIKIPYQPILNSQPSGTVTLSGKGEKGETLTASNTLTDPDGMGTIIYKWYINGTHIPSNDNKNTYIVQAADAEKTITVKATYKDGLGYDNEKESNGISIAALPVPSLTWTILDPFKETIDNDGTFIGKVKIDFVNCKVASSFTFTNNDAISFADTFDINNKPVSITNVNIVKDAGTEISLSLTITAKSSEGEINNKAKLVPNAGLIDTVVINASKNIDIVMTPTPVLSWVLDLNETKNDGSFEGSIEISITNGEFDTAKTIPINDASILTLTDVKDGIKPLTVSSFKQKTAGTVTKTKLTMNIVGKMSSDILKTITDGTLTLKANMVKNNVNDFVYEENGTLIQALGANNLPTGNVTIKGVPNVGEKLTIEENLADIDGLGTFSYQWYRDSLAISGATSNNYTVVSNDLDKNITVKISYTDGLVNSEVVESGGVLIVAKSVLITWATVTNIKEDVTNDGKISGEITATLPTGFSYVASPIVTVDPDIGASPSIVRTSSTVLTMIFNSATVSSVYHATDFKIRFIIDEASIIKPVGKIISNYTSDEYNVDMNEIIPIVTETLTWEIIEPFKEDATNDGKISGELSVTLPPGFVFKSQSNIVFIYGKSILGTKTITRVSDTEVKLTFTNATVQDTTLHDTDFNLSIELNTNSYTTPSGKQITINTTSVPIKMIKNNPVTGSVTISGDPYVGKVLTSSNTLTDIDGLGTLNYQWLRNGVNISGATSSTYTTVNDDLNKNISLKISYTDNNGNAEEKVSSTINIQPVPKQLSIAIASYNDNIHKITIASNTTGATNYNWKLLLSNGTEMVATTYTDPPSSVDGIPATEGATFILINKSSYQANLSGSVVYCKVFSYDDGITTPYESNRVTI